MPATQTLYIADTGNHTIRTLDLDTGAIATIAGQPGQPGYTTDTFQGGQSVSMNPTFEAARFDTPTGIAIAGTSAIYIADSGNHAIRLITTSTGTVNLVAGYFRSTGASDAIGVDARFNTPTAIALGTGSTTLYVADSGNHNIRSITLTNRTVITRAGQAGAPGSADGAGSDARFNQPAGIVVNNDLVYIADTANHTLRAGLTPGAPVIAFPPQNWTGPAGDTATYTVGVNGSGPFTYQWETSRRGDTYTPIPGATASSLVLTNVQLTDVGYYRVIVTNADASVTSQAARLNIPGAVTPPVGVDNNVGGWGGGSGGGAPGALYYALLALLVATRLFTAKSNRSV